MPGVDGWDHPRSRGVYISRCLLVTTPPGSSPLARGLRHPQGQRAGACRIIPARAGFTFLMETRLAPLTDHPRSRGVYGEPVPARLGVMGSSPLARGLHQSLLRGVLRRGIIPARAGFTGAVEAVRAPAGIIPARAGFTPEPPARRTPPWDHPRSRGVYRRGRGGQSASGDHPRSRGVYRIVAEWAVAKSGSSPLARGLLTIGPDEPEAFRIIPARAGFTAEILLVVSFVKDHPRSRGVYLKATYRTLSAYGSSPLARGLRRGRRVQVRRARIIPARAGFTERSGRAWPATADHPRSRGVYAAAIAASTPPWGSSPLARGLRTQRAGGPQLGRIIPARAGFTPLRSAGPTGRRDHPRSRGVYRYPGGKARLAPGSSPLARGLRRQGRQRPRGSRIIPARAGFTSPRATRAADGPDHPRSRGVYARARAQG